MLAKCVPRPLLRRSQPQVRLLDRDRDERGSFSTAQVSTALSDPTTNDQWFAASINSSFPRATAFLGDYSNIAALPSGGVAAYWTDMREENCWLAGPGCGRHGEDAYFGIAP